MSDVHDVLYPPKENDTRVIQRRYDAKERLVAWAVQRDDHFLAFRVNSFREVRLESGKTLDVPEAIECRFCHSEIDIDAAFCEVVTYGPFDGLNSQPYQWTDRTYDVETEMQHNRARYYDPTPGRWIDAEPLGFDGNDGHLFRYANQARVAV